MMEERMKYKMIHSGAGLVNVIAFTSKDAVRQFMLDAWGTCDKISDMMTSFNEEGSFEDIDGIFWERYSKERYDELNDAGFDF